MKHEASVMGAHDKVFDLLLIFLCPEGDSDRRLGLTTCEERCTVNTGEPAKVDVDGADRCKVTSIDPRAIFEDACADKLFA